MNDPRHGRLIEVAGVSYLNAKPLLYGLDKDPSIRLHLDVPSRLLDGLRFGQSDVALLPVIDYQKLDGLRIIPSGGIGSDGETLTVRIFSSVPISKITTLACDPDSHTSVVLAQVILAERHGIRPVLTSDGPARLLIGDKVVCDAPAGMDYQLDLGQAWKELTGMPFVFAVWTARQGVELGDLPRRLSRARQNGMEHLDDIIAEHAIPRGWPAGLARKYLAEHLSFGIGDVELRAIGKFHEMAGKLGLIQTSVRPLAICRETCL
jgi:chorismate dehydratase